MRQGTTLYYLLSDHLGSTSIVTNAAGQVISQTKYKTWGEVRYSSGASPTDITFTGQKSYVDSFGLLFYQSRFYDPSLSRFISADSIVPAGAQGLDRYGYTNNNPVRYMDPSGHICVESDGDSDVGMAGNCHGGSDPKYKPGLQGSPSGWTGHDTKPKARFKPQIFINDDTISAAEFTWVTYWANKIYTNSSGNNTLIYGSRYARNQIGINPYINRIGNTGKLFNPATSAVSSLKNGFVWAGFGIDIYSDYSEMINGNYTSAEFAAAATVDTTSNLGIAIASGAAGGAMAGWVAGGPLGATGGAIIGTATAIVTAYGLDSAYESNFRDEWINDVSSFYSNPIGNFVTIPSPIDIGR